MKICVLMVLAATLVLVSINCSAKSIPEDKVNEHKREKREQGHGGGCCKDRKDEGRGQAQEGHEEGGCCQDKDGGGGGHGHSHGHGEGGCCKDKKGQGQEHEEEEHQGGACEIGHGNKEKREISKAEERENGGGGGGDCCQIDNSPNGRQGQKEGGCCQDNNAGSGQGRGNGGGGDCCQVDNSPKGGNRHKESGCCQDNNGGSEPSQGYQHGGGGGGGCCQDNPTIYDTGNVQPYGNYPGDLYDNFQLHDVRPEINVDVPDVPLHNEGILKELLGERFLNNVKKADENTLLFFSTMLGKLQAYMENLKFQAEEVQNDLQLKFDGFDTFATHSDKVIDSALAMVRRRTYEVQWGNKRHSDFKDTRMKG